MSHSVPRDALHNFIIDGLKNAHAMESQAISLTSLQADRLKNYPELQARIAEHLEETKGQRDRLETVLKELDVGPSVLKDFVLKTTGNAAAILHSFMEDEVLKNSFASYAFENFEIAAYTSLIAAAEAFENPRIVAVCTQNLKEEKAMAQWLETHLQDTTLDYISRTMEGVEAKR